jgi:hypothetical protein
VAWLTAALDLLLARLFGSGGRDGRNQSDLTGVAGGLFARSDPPVKFKWHQIVGVHVSRVVSSSQAYIWYSPLQVWRTTAPDSGLLRAIPHQAR